MSQELLRPLLFFNGEIAYVSLFNSIDLMNCFKQN